MYGKTGKELSLLTIICKSIKSATLKLTSIHSECLLMDLGFIQICFQWSNDVSMSEKNRCTGSKQRQTTLVVFFKNAC